MRRPVMKTERRRPRRAEEDAVEAIGDDVEAGQGMPGAAVEAVGDEGDTLTMNAEGDGDTTGVADEPATGSARERLDGILESLLFAAGGPLPLRRMVDVLEGPTAKEIKAALERLTTEYNRPERGIHLLAVAGGYQLRSAPGNAEHVRVLLRERPARLGRAALETVAIIAYRQPATRAEIEAVRGVDADSALNSLLAKRLIKIAGRKETVGRPLMYATTPEFLEVFGLNDLGELPALKEIGPVQEPEDETASDDGDEWRAATEDSEPRGDQLATGSGGSDPGGPGRDERPDGDRAGDASEPATGSDHD
jgi:segregation and condensation protein B